MNRDGNPNGQQVQERDSELEQIVNQHIREEIQRVPLNVQPTINEQLAEFVANLDVNGVYSALALNWVPEEYNFPNGGQNERLLNEVLIPAVGGIEREFTEEQMDYMIMMADNADTNRRVLAMSRIRASLNQIQARIAEEIAHLEENNGGYLNRESVGINERAYQGIIRQLDTMLVHDRNEIMRNGEAAEENLPEDPIQ